MIIIDIFFGLLLIYALARHIELSHKRRQDDFLGNHVKREKKRKMTIKIRPESI